MKSVMGEYIVVLYHLTKYKNVINLHMLLVEDEYIDENGIDDEDEEDDDDDRLKNTINNYVIVQYFRDEKKIFKT